MTNEQSDKAADAALSLPTWLRAGLCLSLAGLAVVHVIFPKLAIDAVFLGLLAFAALVWFFDFRSIEWLGIRAERRQIKRAKEALDKGAAAPTPTSPPEPPIPSAPAPSPTPPVTVHTPPKDLWPPTERLDRVLWGAEQIRIELLVLLGSSGHLRTAMPWGEYAIAELVQSALTGHLITKEQAEAILTVARMRNLAVHQQLLDPAWDLAMDVVQALRSLPRTYNRVRQAHISLFRDRSLSTPFAATHGVMLAQVTEDGKISQVSVFPRSFEYSIGRFVTWLWDMNRVFKQEAWYSDPVTKEPRMAWSEAATFVGVEYPDQWGLPYRLPRPDLGLIT